MPAPVQRRVRSGCLTCRGRRRKCDEAKPVCNNCHTKDLICRYGVNVTFVPQKRLDFQRTQRSHLSREAGFQTERDVNTSQSNVFVTSSTDGTPEPSRLQSRANNLIEAAHEQLICRVDAPQQQPNTTFHYEQTFTPIHLSSNGGASQIGCEGHLATWSLPPEQHSPHHRSQNNQQTDPIAGETRGTASSSGPEIIDEVRDQYELGLLIYYRYKVAPVLDLGVGSLYFGVQALVNSAQCRRLYQAILAVASCHRAAVGSPCFDIDQVTSGSCASDVDMNCDPASSEDRVTSIILLLWRSCLINSPAKWLQVFENTTLPAFDEGLVDEHRQLLSRILLAATLMAPAHMVHIGRLWKLNDLLQTFSGPPPPEMFAQHQLQQSLRLLNQSLRFWSGNTQSHDSMQTPLVPAWQSCWRDSQSWFSRRTDEMHEIFAADDSTLHGSQSSNRTVFPVIVYSNACATVANIVHHLTTMLLLQQKPRLVKAVCDSHSSISPIWHARRIVGIATAAAETEVWDPLVVAVILQGAKRLSHSAQISAVAEILQKACKGSGMQFEAGIDRTDQASLRLTGE